MAFKGIDVSAHQGKIDWKKVKADGIEFAIIRCGYGSDMPDQDDKQFTRNVSECEKHGIPYGVYLYSYATNLTEAESEVQHVLRLLKGYVPMYPVYIDMEDADGYKRKHNVSDAMCVDICLRFCEEMTKAGYYAGVYANKDWLVNKINDLRLSAYPIWLAQWNSKPTYDGKFGIWQFTSSGNVDGIGTRVDMNLCYEDYPAIIKGKELNGYKKPAPKPAPKPTKKSNDAIAEEVIAGKWGNGAERKKKLKAAGYDYDAIQQLVNQKLSPKKETSKPKKETPKPAPKPAAKPAKIKVGDMISYTGRLYLTSYGILPGKKVSGKFKVDRVIEGRKYGIHIPGGWIEASKAKRK